MPRTDQEIYEYMSYYNTTSCRKWAFENLCRCENKTPEEIKEICKREGEKVKKYSDSVKNAVICDRLKGVPASRIACEQGLTTKQVENIFTMYKQKQKALETADNPPQVAEKIPYKEPEIIKPPKTAKPTVPPTRDDYWYAVIEELREFAKGVLGAGTIVVRAKADAKEEMAAIVVKTADGRKVGLSMLTIADE